MKRIIVLVTVVIVCLSVLSGCGEEKPKFYSVNALPEGTWRDSEVNAVTYVDNNFIAAAQGDTHYYVSDSTATETEGGIYRHSDACIYREDMTGEHEIEKIDISGEWRWINPVGDYIYYVNCNSGGMIRGGKIERYDMVTKQTKVFEFPKLGNYIYNDLFVVGEQMYFMSCFYKDISMWYRICRADLNGRNAEILKEERSLDFLGNDEKYIYYDVYSRNENDEKIRTVYALSLDGEEDRELFKVLADDYSGFCVAKNSTGQSCIYGQAAMTEFGMDTDIVTIYNVADGTEKKVYEYEIDTYDTDYQFEIGFSSGDDIYFTYSNNIGKFIPESLETKHVAGTNNSIESISVVGEHIYYTTDKNFGGSFYDYTRRINPDGSIDKITVDVE